PAAAPPAHPTPPPPGKAAEHKTPGQARLSKLNQKHIQTERTSKNQIRLLMSAPSGMNQTAITGGSRSGRHPQRKPSCFTTNPVI
ncbi:hypothetical protein JYK14_27860, partial [Siccirubricoccus sp. KC 17139]